MPKLDRTQKILPLSIRGVSIEFLGRCFLRTNTLEIKGGEPTFLLGPNGSGKTLFLKACHGLIEPTQGAISWLGYNSSDAYRYQSMVLQRPVLLRRSTRANIDYALRASGLSKEQRKDRIQKVLKATGLEKIAEKAARNLSGGEQQRLAIARAWATEPEVLFLDEPTASLDPGTSSWVERTLSAIVTNKHKIVMSTHDLGLVKRLGGEVIFLHQGRILERTLSKTFFECPTTPEGRAFIANELSW